MFEKGTHQLGPSSSTDFKNAFHVSRSNSNFHASRLHSNSKSSDGLDQSLLIGHAAFSKIKLTDEIEHVRHDSRTQMPAVVCGTLGPREPQARPTQERVGPYAHLATPNQSKILIWTHAKSMKNIDSLWPPAGWENHLSARFDLINFPEKQVHQCRRIGLSRDIIQSKPVALRGSVGRGRTFSDR